MFEMSLVESSGRLKSKSSRYMWITGAFNLAVVTVMMLLPLLYPEAMPKAALVAMVVAPPPPAAAPPLRPTAIVRAAKAASPLNALTAPVRVPTRIDTIHEDAPPSTVESGVASMKALDTDALGPAGAIGLGIPPPVVKVSPKTTAVAPTKISSGVIAGNKLFGASPIYPPIAKAAHVSGAVVLHAVISRTGAIRSLSVISGPEMLRANAVASVQEWRYRPYLLNGEPTEVDTTITVNFSFGS